MSAKSSLCLLLAFLVVSYAFLDDLSLRVNERSKVSVEEFQDIFSRITNLNSRIKNLREMKREDKLPSLERARIYLAGMYVRECYRIPVEEWKRSYQGLPRPASRQYFYEDSYKVE